MSNDLQQIATPFDGYTSDLATFVPTADRGGAGAGGGAVAERHHHHDSLLWRAHHNLRGGYWIAITMGVILGLAGGDFGYRVVHPIYRGEGVVQISLNSKNPLCTSNSRPNFSEYVQSPR